MVYAGKELDRQPDENAGIRGDRWKAEDGE